MNSEQIYALMAIAARSGVNEVRLVAVHENRPNAEQHKKAAEQEDRKNQWDMRLMWAHNPHDLEWRWIADGWTYRIILVPFFPGPKESDG